MTRSDGISIFKFWKKLYTIFHNGCTSLHSHQQCMGVFFSLITLDISFVFYFSHSDRGPEHIFVQARHTDGQQTHEKTLNITHRQRNANRSPNNLSSDTHQNGSWGVWSKGAAESHEALLPVWAEEPRKTPFGALSTTGVVERGQNEGKNSTFSSLPLLTFMPVLWVDEAVAQHVPGRAASLHWYLHQEKPLVEPCRREPRAGT